MKIIQKFLRCLRCKLLNFGGLSLWCSQISLKRDFKEESRKTWCLANRYTRTPHSYDWKKWICYSGNNKRNLIFYEFISCTKSKLSPIYICIFQKGIHMSVKRTTTTTKLLPPPLLRIHRNNDTNFPQIKYCNVRNVI